MYEDRSISNVPKLKPLYANLKRLKIGDYLFTKEFELYAIENNIDEVWSDCRREVNRKKRVIILFSPIFCQNIRQRPRATSSLGLN
jgi:hypothetical protein